VYNTLYSHVKNALLKEDLVLHRKVLHVFRRSTCRQLDIMGCVGAAMVCHSSRCSTRAPVRCRVDFQQIQRMGRWNKDVMTQSYMTGVPHKAVLGAAGHDYEHPKQGGSSNAPCSMLGPHC
jgi:hypothetical protein